MAVVEEQKLYNKVQKVNYVSKLDETQKDVVQELLTPVVGQQKLVRESSVAHNLEDQYNDVKILDPGTISEVVNLNLREKLGQEDALWHKLTLAKGQQISKKMRPYSNNGGSNYWRLDIPHLTGTVESMTTANITLTLSKPFVSTLQKGEGLPIERAFILKEGQKVYRLVENKYTNSFVPEWITLDKKAKFIAQSSSQPESMINKPIESIKLKKDCKIRVESDEIILDVSNLKNKVENLVQTNS